VPHDVAHDDRGVLSVGLSTTRKKSPATSPSAGVNDVAISRWGRSGMSVGLRTARSDSSSASWLCWAWTSSARARVRRSSSQRSTVIPKNTSERLSAAIHSPPAESSGEGEISSLPTNVIVAVVATSRPPERPNQYTPSTTGIRAYIEMASPGRLTAAKTAVTARRRTTTRATRAGVRASRRRLAGDCRLTATGRCAARLGTPAT
jgi:hypothetical protein